ncbi:hypothetical protein Y032_0541g3198 [Ancylostoma ceylanicum]|uniref:Uncharacterized protein n=1 Tax=Ancylostoma ceylanicum TaxID=53326 RepID=A0A016WQS8_9BILA|nr:hypothetical protein Y032_0541g3198 [Ancylostoma ceylanicum]
MKQFQLKIVDPNAEGSVTHEHSAPKCSPFPHPLAPLNFDVSEEEYVEQCNLQEDESPTEMLHRQNSIVLENPENEAEYWQKLISTGNLSNVEEEDDTIEMCGPEDEPDDYDDILNPPGGSVVLSEPGPNFTYESPDGVDFTDLGGCTLEEMEEMFETFGEILFV